MGIFMLYPNTATPLTAARTCLIVMAASSLLLAAMASTPAIEMEDSCTDCSASDDQALLQTRRSLEGKARAHSTTPAASFTSARPGSCCALEAHTFLTWTEFQQQSGAYDENISKGVPLVVPCGYEVTIDQSMSEALPGIRVEGSLKFQDGIDIKMETAFLFVCGNFSIGSPAGPHTANVEIVLTGDTEVTWSSHGAAQMSFGTAGFITYGGLTYIRGSACDAKPWTRLSATISPPEGSELNLALGKPATQSSLGHHRYTAEKAVDGKVDWKGSSILTLKEDNPWWYVHISSLSNVGSVMVTERPHRGIDLSNAIVGITDSPCQPGLLCGGQICSHSMTRSGIQEFACGGSSGDYLYVQLRGQATLTLSEVEIFSAASADYELQLQGSTHEAWNVGDELVITSTSRDAEETEEAIILETSVRGVKVSGRLAHEHLGCSEGSEECTMAAEVASLSRNVIIRGEAGCQPLCGHFMIAHTQRGFVCGAEFTNLGQTAVEGRYPLHVHLPGEAPELVLKGNSLHHNHNRGLVMHGVHNMTAESNVCFRTKGHCFMTEDGVEQYNVFKSNIGVLPSPLNFGCSHTHDSTFTCPHRSDSSPNAFWISNPNNFFVGNVGIATGVAFNFELRHVTGAVRRLFPDEAMKIGRHGKVKGSIPLAEFSRNTAHSSGNGLNNYPRMSLPPGGRNRYDNFTAWRCDVGMGTHNSPNFRMPMVGARLFENLYGVRAGLSDTRIELIESHITAAQDASSVPLIINKFGKTRSDKLPIVFTIDNYTRNWVRCYGGYRNGLFFGMFEDPDYEQPCRPALLSPVARVNESLAA